MPSTTRDRVLRIYWSASVEAHALGAMALRTRFPDERAGLMALHAMEQQRGELARRLLRDVWHLVLPPLFAATDSTAA